MTDQDPRHSVTPLSPAVGDLTPAERVAASQRAWEWENVRLGHAISLLNNHLPAYGFRSSVESSEGWKSKVDDTMIDSVPEPLKALIQEVLEEAARFTIRCLKDTTKDG